MSQIKEVCKVSIAFQYAFSVSCISKDIVVCGVDVRRDYHGQEQEQELTQSHNSVQGCW